jgi:hypothetical protein
MFIFYTPFPYDKNWQNAASTKGFNLNISFCCHILPGNRLRALVVTLCQMKGGM